MTEIINFDRLLYPIMMQIRAVRDLPKTDDPQETLCKAILDCQNKVEGMILSLMTFTLDYLIEGQSVKLTYGKELYLVRKELLLKLQLMHDQFKKIDIQALKHKIFDELYHGEGFSDSDSDNQQNAESFQIKLVQNLINQTGHLREFNPEIQELQQKNKDQEQEILKLRSKVSYRQNSMEVLTQNHFKEMQNMKQQLQQKAQLGDQFELFEVSYFDQTIMLEPEVIEIMNEKIRDIKQQYERFVYLMIQKRPNSIETTPKSKTVVVQNQNQEQNHSVSELIRMALNKEPNVFKIWKNLQDCKYDFLQVLKQQEQGYGIVYQELNEFVKNTRPQLIELVQARLQMEDLVAQTSSNYIGEIETQRKENMMMKMQQESQRLEYEERLSLLGSSSIGNLMSKYGQLEFEMSNQKSMLVSCRSEIKQLKCQLNCCLGNLKFMLKLINPKFKNLQDVDRIDFFKDKNEVVRDLEAKLKNLDSTLAASMAQVIQLTFYQNNSMNIVSNLKQQKNKEIHIQTDLLGFEIFTKELEIVQPKQIVFKAKMVAQTQTDTIPMVLPSPGAKISTDVLHSMYQEQKEMNYLEDLSPLKDSPNVFDRLFAETRKANLRIKSLKAFIEKLSEEEYQELYSTLSVHQYKSTHLQFNPYTQYCNPVVELPQQEIPYNMNGSKLLAQSVKKGNKSKDYSLDGKLDLFIELDDQREQASKLFEQNRLDTYRRRLKRLVPVPLSQALKIEDKLRPKSQQKTKRLKLQVQ